jgi:hypothetical protein
MVRTRSSQQDYTLSFEEWAPGPAPRRSRYDKPLLPRATGVFPRRRVPRLLLPALLADCCPSAKIGGNNPLLLPGLFGSLARYMQFTLAWNGYMPVFSLKDASI